jgi:hypothetical protein
MNAMVRSLALLRFEGANEIEAREGLSSPASGILKALVGFIVVSVIVTTLTHYLWPELTGVPSHPVETSVLVAGDILVSIMGICAFFHARRTMGASKATIFLVSCWLFAGVEETAWILCGRFGLVPPTYYFTYGGLWFFEIPVYTCIAWFLICYCGYAMVRQMFPRIRPAGVAATTAGFGTCWDLWLDPVVCNRHLVSSLPDLWVWLSPSGIRLFEIPLLNFAGWFGVIFTIIFVFDRNLRPAAQVTGKIERAYYVSLALGWGLLFVALHVVGVAQYVSTASLLPVHFGTAVDPAAGAASILPALHLGYFVLLVAGSAAVVTHLRKRRVDQALRLLPALLIGWWLNAGLEIAANILAVYPESSLPWLMAMSSLYPVAIIITSLPLNRAEAARSVYRCLSSLTLARGNGSSTITIQA